MRNSRFSLLLAAALFVLPAASLAGAPGAVPANIPAEVLAQARSLKPKQGRVAIPQARATLDLGNEYDFYGPEDTRTILTSFWGNPPEASEGVLGLVMPAGASPLSDTWGAVVTYQDSGYVSDKDAAEVDYEALLVQMRESEAEDNKAAKAAGYPEGHLVGWAQRPQYDPSTHSVIWARDINFAGAQANTLNYDIRTLGRSGVLSLNLVSSMPKLDQVRVAAKEFAQHASFDPGARYEDFDPSRDRTADYGIGGLVAAGVGLAAAKKLGLLAILLKFLKPILLGAVVLIGLLRNRIMDLFDRGKKDEG